MNAALRDIRDVLCWYAGHLTGGKAASLYDAGMIVRALAYYIDEVESRPLTDYSRGVLEHWGRPIINRALAWAQDIREEKKPCK